MSATKIIGNIDVFKNGFTRYGRNKNYLMQQLKDYGFSEFRERTLKDKSQVMLAYRGSKKLADFAFRFFPDLSIEQKNIKRMQAYFINSHKLQIISKSLHDKKGKLVNDYIKKMRYENGEFLKKEEIIKDKVKDVLIKKEETIRGVSVPSLRIKNVVKSYVKLKDNDMYGFYQQADGTRHYVKNIDGVKYKFSSK